MRTIEEVLLEADQKGAAKILAAPPESVFEALQQLPQRFVPVRKDDVFLPVTHHRPGSVAAELAAGHGRGCVMRAGELVPAFRQVDGLVMVLDTSGP
jgi:hypothetical protein